MSAGVGQVYALKDISVQAINCFKKGLLSPVLPPE